MVTGVSGKVRGTGDVRGRPARIEGVGEVRTPLPVHEALRARVNAIPEGQVSQTARDAGLDLTQLLRLKRGEALDVKLSTLSRLASALGEPIGQALGETGEATPARGAILNPKVASRIARNLAEATRRLALVSADVQRLFEERKREPED